MEMFRQGREILETWTLVARRLGFPRDLRRFIGEMIWAHYKFNGIFSVDCWPQENPHRPVKTITFLDGEIVAQTGAITYDDIVNLVEFASVSPQVFIVKMESTYEMMRVCDEMDVPFRLDGDIMERLSDRHALRDLLYSQTLEWPNAIFLHYETCRKHGADGYCDSGYKVVKARTYGELMGHFMAPGLDGFCLRERNPVALASAIEKYPSRCPDHLSHVDFGHMYFYWEFIAL
jgi:hypothetical protein